MSYFAYKWLHIVGVLFVFLAIGGMTYGALNGRADERNRGRKLAGMTHGIALLVVLVSGFGLVARLGVGFQPWSIAKIVVWLLIGASIALIRRMPQAAGLFWLAMPLLGGLAAYLAIFKPGS